ncbi:uncharacterized protein LOC114729739 [Neltuma alba]|uniref:uncharacterized protein LOC114723722 n=1 Tax=Neltuma alba TaxID=207710 RepID=UPI0010A464F2|nr:uncharacterized protein LOC114723722 [Prosopis alba]XP_028772609.1 uncharacterized protein LOC114729739 [Prosopis alba]
MASSFCKSVLRVSSRSFGNRSSSLIQKHQNAASLPAMFSSRSSTIIPHTSRILSVLGSFESMMPLHTAIADARLTSSIASDSTCWSWLSRGLEKTL